MKDKKVWDFEPKYDRPVLAARLNQIGRWDFYGLSWNETRKHPNFFHRKMVKIFFGIKYTKL